MDEKLELVRSISGQLLRIIKKQGRIEESPVPLTRDASVTPTESHAIQAIGEYEPISVTRLAHVLGVTKSAASQLSTRLMLKTYIKKSYSKENNKELQLGLTERGWLAYEAHKQCHERHLADIANRMGSFPLSHIATVKVVFDVIEDALDARLDQE